MAQTFFPRVELIQVKSRSKNCGLVRALLSRAGTSRASFFHLYIYASVLVAACLRPVTLAIFRACHRLEHENKARLEMSWLDLFSGRATGHMSWWIKLASLTKALQRVQARYPNMEKLTLDLVTTLRQLQPYFQNHSIEVLTNFPLKQVLEKLGASKRLTK